MMAQTRCGRPDIERDEDVGCASRSGRLHKRYAAGSYVYCIVLIYIAFISCLYVVVPCMYVKDPTDGKR